MTRIDLEGLRDFAAAGDREAPPYFAGRADVLRDIGSAAQRCWTVWNKSRRKTPGATRVIYGAPGAGKSSILMHLERSWSGPGGGAPAMLRLDAPADFEDGTMLAAKLADRLRPGEGRKIGAEVTKAWQVQAGAGGIGGQYARESRAMPVPDPIEAVLRHVPGASWTGPVAIAVDEFQNAGGDTAAPHAKVLQKLHAHAYDAPVFAVLAGLSNTLDTVDRLGISRRSIDTASSLGCLEPEESEDLFAGWSDHFGLPDEGPWKTAMRAQAAAGSHWPAHVHNALAAFAEEIVRAEGDMAHVDMRQVEERAEERRRKYYQSRMSDQMKDSRWLIGAVMAHVRDDMDRGDIKNLVNRHADSASEDVRWHLPKGMDADDYYRHILHRGVIQEDGLQVTAPIPSFRRWIIENCTPRHSPDADAAPDPSALPDPYATPTPFD